MKKIYLKPTVEVIEMDLSELLTSSDSNSYSINRNTTVDDYDDLE